MANHDRVNTALLLAAGTGSRLRPLTKNAPKCLTEVGGIPILERLINNLREQEIERLVVVTGHLGDQIRNFLSDYADDLLFDYIHSSAYRTTNNIYSLWLAREQIQEPFLLLESDLVFDAPMLKDMLHPDKIAISRIHPWMNGTTVTVTPDKRVDAFHTGSGEENKPARYKAVNIYSLSAQTWNETVARLDSYIQDGRVGLYYEAVFADMVADGAIAFEATFFDPNRWYEVDTTTDLDEADRMFRPTNYLHARPDVRRLQSVRRVSPTSIVAND